MSFYTILSVDGPSHRRVTGVPEDAPWPPVYAGRDHPMDAFTTIYRFDQRLADFAAAHAGLTRGYSGPCQASGIHMDLDGPSALADAQTLVRRLLGDHSLGIFCEDVRAWFSGSKGFHFFVDDEAIFGRGLREDTPQYVKAVALRLAGGLQSFDPGVYDRLRLWRIAGSQHPKTQLYKIGLDLDTLLSSDIGVVRALAQRPHDAAGCARLRLHNIQGWGGAA